MEIKKLKKISDYEWEIPKQGSMLVPGRIIASKKLIEEMDEKVYEQTSNIAHLPGIINYSLCHSDGHWGYGFPIGGVAAVDLNEGVISPGGVGFDINCLDGNTKIRTEYGYYKKIKDFEKEISTSLKSIEFEDNKLIETKPILFMKKPADTKVYEITTKSGDKIKATADHPFYTKKGMKLLEKLTPNDQIAVNPFEGIEYEQTSDEIIIDEKDIIKIVGNRKKLINTLREKNLLPLKYNSPHLPILTKLVGFLTGDGWLGYYFNKKRNQDVWAFKAIGKKEDLEEIKRDIEKIGFSSSNLRTYICKSNVKELDGSIRKIEGESIQFSVTSQSLAILLHALGVPQGNKSRKNSNLPLWLKKSPLWIKRLYLASLFGAELSKPTQNKKNKHYFIEPTISQNKIKTFESNLRNFLIDISKLLEEFGIKSNKIYKLKGVINKQNEETIKLSLKISSEIKNLIRLWKKVGYEYSTEKRQLSMLALQYLQRKVFTLNLNKQIVEEALILKEKGINYSRILEHASEKGASVSMVSGKLYRPSENFRITKDFPSFNEFILKYGLKENADFSWDEIHSIKETEHNNLVYDFTINHHDHNFIANSFVVSNCGMKLIKTNITLEEFKPKVKELTDHLFKTVPAGVGSKGFLKINQSQFKEIMQTGIKWCIENGYGWKQDIERTEDSGTLKNTDPEKVSQKAISRGINQLGTLGSGNHYLEMQVSLADNIFDEKIAKKLGIEKNRIMIMVHCGSRGFGHGIASDYLRVFDQAMRKYNIKVPDRELSCAPFQSQEGQDYFQAMNCAGNMAFANRQVILHRIREGFSKVFNKSAEELEIELIQDNTHNLARIQKLRTKDGTKKLLVHLKGSTRSLGPDHEDLSNFYKDIGSGICLGGSMETGSYFLVGTKKSEETTFGTTAHGSGRTMSRSQAKRQVRGDKLQRDMEKRGIYVRGVSMAGLAEEAGLAYKNIDAVIDSISKAGISKPVVKLKPLANVKG
ncbi:MAG: RtcB family protein [Nanoarchaeota archaeon]